MLKPLLLLRPRIAQLPSLQLHWPHGSAGQLLPRGWQVAARTVQLWDQSCHGQVLSPAVAAKQRVVRGTQPRPKPHQHANQRRLVRRTLSSYCAFRAMLHSRWLLRVSWSGGSLHPPGCGMIAVLCRCVHVP